MRIHPCGPNFYHKHITIDMTAGRNILPSVVLKELSSYNDSDGMLRASVVLAGGRKRCDN